MSKVNDKGFLSGHIGNIVYRELNGRQIVQSMPSHYRDAKTEAQLKQRSGMRNILAHHRILKDVIKSQFEDAVGTFDKLSTSPHRPYDCFKHHNLLLPAVELSKKGYNMGLCIIAPYIVSHGTLSPLDIAVVDNTLQFQMSCEDWKKGDILRFIRVKSKASPKLVTEPVVPSPARLSTYGAQEGEQVNNTPIYLTASYSDIIINKVEDKLIVSEPLESGAYTYIHLRRTSKGWQASTQRLILL